MSFHANADGIKRLAAALKDVAPEDVQKALRDQVRDAGSVIGDKAKQNASWSKKIPPTIRWTTSSAQLTTKVTVTAGYKNVPIARWYEFGRTQRSPVWRHPVYPSSKWALKGIREARKHWHWVKQRDPKRPYLHPALAETKDEVTIKILTALVDALQAVVDEAEAA